MKLACDWAVIGAVGREFDMAVFDFVVVFDLDRDTTRFFLGAMTAPPSSAPWPPGGRDIKLG